MRNGMSLNFGEINMISDIFGEERISIREHITKRGDVFVVTLKKRVPRKLIKLWWPNGAGAAQLYTLSFQYENNVLGTKTDWVEKRIGKSLFNFYLKNSLESELYIIRLQNLCPCYKQT